MGYIDADELIKEMQEGKYANPCNDFQRGVNASIDIQITGIKHMPTADVERLNHILDSYALQYGTVTDKQKVLDKAKSEVLSNLKKQIHDRAVYPHNAGISPYVSLKVVDALINNLMSR